MVLGSCFRLEVRGAGLCVGVYAGCVSSGAIDYPDC